ncbi:Amine oxidase [Danaus plexippus plexippus]|uniref:monoamine oxidase n=1 Tax=Danaus plexippus plexippus TaxID=278856 RepID=A0A212EZ07_DANPL|nr:Amine oxidase [Danaus plexippus plexippus]
MDIVVLDLAGRQTNVSKCNVAFQEENEEEDECDDTGESKVFTDSITKRYLSLYAADFNIPLPDAIMAPERKFELNQYQNLLNEYMKDLFQQNNTDNDSNRKRLLYYDHTTMEAHICSSLLFSNSRELMRNTVRLVCGTSADNISVLFYLHQCHRSNNSRNLLDGDNTKLREKLIGYCRKRLAAKLQKSVASITLTAKSINKISSYSDEQVILKTIKGDTNYVCNLLAMAVKPDELHNIEVEAQLLSDQIMNITASMKQGIAKKFLVQYEEHFWRREGYSGDILSVRGPILWATERPIVSSKGSLERYAALIGYLRVKEPGGDSREAVLKQLVRLFGNEAAEPIGYRETIIADTYIPRCGDFVALRRLTRQSRPKFLEWGALDIFGDGDVASALEAGHMAYVHLLGCLRPQAQSYDDLSTTEWPTNLGYSPIRKLLSQLTITTSLRYMAYTAAAYVGFRLMQSRLRN